MTTGRSEALAAIAVEATEGGSAAAPRHVAIIMDGNGRWATQRGLPRVEGHRRGVEAVRRTVRAAHESGIRFLTLYSFSRENWSRPAAEIAELMGLLKRFIRKDLADLHARNIRVRVIGDRDELADDLRALIDEAEAVTARNTAFDLVIAFNYGARQEITAAVRALAGAAAVGALDARTIDEAMLAAALNTHAIPDPDLLIRTSGEQRLSNFLLWQAAYAELVFLPVLWPDFDRRDLDEALLIFGRRERRFGGIGVRR
jgi:undecaprenyl diphosphate synthase